MNLFGTLLQLKSLQLLENDYFIEIFSKIWMKSACVLTVFKEE